MQTAARTAANERARAPRPLTLILGRDEDEWLLVAFGYVDDELMPAQLRVFDGDNSDLLAALDVGRHVKPRRLASALRGASRAR